MTHSPSNPSLSALRCSLLASAVSLVITPVAANQAMAAVIQVRGACSLVDAIYSANANASANCTAGDAAGTDTIVLQNSSVYTLDTLNNKTDGSNGLPLIDSNITIQGNDSTISRSSSAPDFRLFHVTAGNTLTLDNVTVSNGIASEPGGAVFNRGTVKIQNRSSLSGNSSAKFGGGLYNANNSTAVLTNSTVSKNVANDGGGIASGLGAVLQIEESTITGNSAQGVVVFSISGGGGLLNYGSQVLLINATVSGNSVAASLNGGGMYNSYSSITLINSTISGNSADSGGGFFNKSSHVQVFFSTVSGNSASLYGGGLFDTTSTITLANSTVSGNSAPGIGGIHNAGGTLSLTNSTVSGNSATFLSANVYNAGSSVARLSNSIVANAMGGSDCGGGGPLTDVTSNWFEDNSCGRTGNGDPRLAPLADNGGATQTHALLRDSGAIDAGDNAVCAAAPVNNLDQRGITRPQGEKCDIGSFEYKGSKFFVIPAKNGKTVIFKL